MRKMLCLKDCGSVIQNEIDAVFGNRFYYINNHDEVLTHNGEFIYEVYSQNIYAFDNWEYEGIFFASNFIDLAEYRDKQIDEILNEDDN